MLTGIIKAIPLVAGLVSKLVDIWERRQIKKQLRNEIYLEELKANDGAKKEAKQAAKHRQSHIDKLTIDELRAEWENKSKKS